MRAGGNGDLWEEGKSVIGDTKGPINSDDAKQFLVSRIVDQALLEDVEFSELERKMLYYSETHPSLPDMDTVLIEFNQTYNMFPVREGRFIPDLQCLSARSKRSCDGAAMEGRTKDAAVGGPLHKCHAKARVGDGDSETRSLNLHCDWNCGCPCNFGIYCMEPLGH